MFTFKPLLDSIIWARLAPNLPHDRSFCEGMPSLSSLLSIYSILISLSFYFVDFRLSPIKANPNPIKPNHHNPDSNLGPNSNPNPLNLDHIINPNPHLIKPDLNLLTLSLCFYLEPALSFFSAFVVCHGFRPCRSSSLSTIYLFHVSGRLPLHALFVGVCHCHRFLFPNVSTTSVSFCIFCISRSYLTLYLSCMSVL
jgi:hypothetical protein